MEKTYNLFRKFLPIIIGCALVGFAFSLLTLIYYYNDSTISINFLNVMPILTILIFLGTIALVIYFSLKIKSLGLAKIKKSFGFSKFAASLTAALAAALFFFDFFRFVQTPTTSSPLRIARILIFIPFIAYFVVNMLPSRIKRKKLVLPRWLRPLTSTCALIWAIIGLLMVYFWGGLPAGNVFRLIHTFYYILLIVFFMFEAKFEFFAPMPRAYIMSSLLLFVYSFVLTGSITLTKVLGGVESVSISDFELFLSFSIGIYALSRMICVMQTLKFVMSKSSGSHRRHRHHHHHTASSSVQAAKATPSSDAGESNSSENNNTENK